MSQVQPDLKAWRDLQELLVLRVFKVQQGLKDLLGRRELPGRQEHRDQLVQQAPKEQRVRKAWQALQELLGLRVFKVQQDRKDLPGRRELPGRPGYRDRPGHLVPKELLGRKAWQVSREQLGRRVFQV